MLGPFGPATLPDGVTVARVTLDHLVQVRILVGQLLILTVLRSNPCKTGVVSFVFADERSNLACMGDTVAGN